MKRFQMIGLLLGCFFIIGLSLYAFDIFTYDSKQTFQVKTVLKQRPANNQYVFDFANLLEYSKENKEESLKFFTEKYGVEMLIVTVPHLDGGDIGQVAHTLFNNWNIGKSYNGKGVLLLLAKEEKQIKVEVGLNAEGIFTDLFCGYIERKQLKPYFENNQVDFGLSATMEEFIGRAEGRFTDDDLKIEMQGYLSVGAGIKKDVKIGNFTQKIINNSDSFSMFPAQSTPEDLYRSWVHSLKICYDQPNISMYTVESQIMLYYSSMMSKGVCQDLYQRYSQAHEIKVQGDYAVLLIPGGKKQGPIFMKKNHRVQVDREDAIGWQVDMLSVSKWVRYNFRNEWYLGGRNHPYAFAFKSEPYKSFVRDYDFYDDYKKFSDFFLMGKNIFLMRLLKFFSKVKFL